MGQPSKTRPWLRHQQIFREVHARGAALKVPGVLPWVGWDEMGATLWEEKHGKYGYERKMFHSLVK